MQGASALPAFIGAEGYGAVATGGRGGSVIMVSTLNATGTGSLYEALRTPGDRVIIFNVSGIINLSGVPYDPNNACPSPCIPVGNETVYQYGYGNVTILGQSSPGYGIVVKGGIAFKQGNIILRYISVRPGYNFGQTGIRVSFDSGYIFDHLSVSWVSDDMIDLYQYGSPSDRPGGNTTVSYSLIAEGFCDSPSDMTNCWAYPMVAVGTVVGGAYWSTENWSNLDYHHNFVAHVQDRMPYLRNAKSTVINNIFYNGEYAMSALRGGGHFDFVNNSFNRQLPYGLREIGILGNGGVESMGINGTPSLYVSGNKDFNGTIPSTQWNIVGEGFGSGYQTFPTTAGWQRLTSNDASEYQITTVSANELNDTILPTVGNSRYIVSNGSWVNRNDFIDQRIITNYTAGTGDVKANETDYGGYTTYYSTTHYTDSDNDGISDEWETENGLNPNNNSDSNDIDSNGYMYLENFLSGEEPISESNIATTFTINGSGSGDANWSQFLSDNVVEDLGDHYIKTGIFRDNFNDNNENWQENGGTPSVSNGKYWFNDSGGSFYSVNGNVSWTNYTAYANVLNAENASGVSYAGMYVHNNSNSKVGYRQDWDLHNVVTDSFGDASGLYIPTYNRTLNLSQVYKLKLKIYVNNLTAWFDDFLLGSSTYTSANSVSGNISLRMRNDNVSYDNIYVLPLDNNGDLILSGNFTSWHNWTDGNVTYQVVVNATTPSNTNYSVNLYNNVTGTFIENLGTNLSGNQTLAISNSMQDSKVNITLYGNETATPELIAVTYYAQSPVVHAPNITSWGNDYTNNNTLSFTVPQNTNVTFNATTNQTLTVCSWTGATLINCSANTFAYKLFNTAGTQYVNLNGSNANGSTLNTVNWTINVLPSGGMNPAVAVGAAALGTAIGIAIYTMYRRRGRIFTFIPLI